MGNAIPSGASGSRNVTPATGEPRAFAPAEQAPYGLIMEVQQSGGQQRVSPFCFGTLVTGDPIDAALVATDTALTARHCTRRMAQKRQADPSAQFAFGVGSFPYRDNGSVEVDASDRLVPIDSFDDEAPVLSPLRGTEFAPHPADFAGDVAVIRLAEPIEAPVREIGELEPADVGQTLMGTSYSHETKGRVHTPMTLKAMGPTADAPDLVEDYLAHADPAEGRQQPCRSDSGGPLEVSRNGRTYVVGVAAAAVSSCTGGVLYATFGPRVREVIDSALQSPPR